MKTTTFICDCCKNSVGDKELVTLRLNLSGLRINKQSDYGYHATSREYDICKGCLIKKGFDIIPTENSKDADDKQKQIEKTLSDKIIDILQDLDVAFVE